MESKDPEIRREKVFVSPEMSVKEISEKYGVCPSTANLSRKRGWLIKNYSRKQIIIDREHFHGPSAYSIARQVYFKNFSNNPVAQSIKEDLIQEAVTLMFMQSGKVREGASEKYNDKYGWWWCAHNAQLSYLKTWIRQTRYDVELQDEIHPYMTYGNRRYSPEFGWIHC